MLKQLVRVALCLVFNTRVACAAWLQCAATGQDANGSVGFYTTLVDVGEVPPERLDMFQKRLLAYAAKFDGALAGAQAQCRTFEDQQAASSDYSRRIAVEARRLGWENIVVVQPSDWLNSNEIVGDAFLP